MVVRPNLIHSPGIGRNGSEFIKKLLESENVPRNIRSFEKLPKRYHELLVDSPRGRGSDGIGEG